MPGSRVILGMLFSRCLQISCLVEPRMPASWWAQECVVNCCALVWILFDDQPEVWIIWSGLFMKLQCSWFSWWKCCVMLSLLRHAMLSLFRPRPVAPITPYGKKCSCYTPLCSLCSENFSGYVRMMKDGHLIPVSTRADFYLFDQMCLAGPVLIQ